MFTICIYMIIPPSTYLQNINCWKRRTECYS